jgi:hypothetical protein
MSPVGNPIICCLTISATVSMTACGSSGTQPASPTPTASLSISGRVLEVFPGVQVTVADFPVSVRVIPSGCDRLGCTVAITTRTASDGRYSVGDLPAGRVIVIASTASHAQLCGVTSLFSANTQLDVEITSRTNRQPSMTRPPVRVSGQIFRNTPAGRVGVSNGEIALDLSMSATTQTISTAPFLEVDADANGNYLACGLPANWPLKFISGFEDYQAWHQFGADATLDIERRQP